MRHRHYAQYDLIIPRLWSKSVCQETLSSPIHGALASFEADGRVIVEEDIEMIIACSKLVR